MPPLNPFMRALRAALPAPRAAHARVRMRVEEMEPRILHSADFVPGAFGEALSPTVELRMLEAVPESANSETTAQHGISRELVIVDRATPDYQMLIDHIVADAGPGRSIEVVLIDSTRDGIDQITDALSSRHDLEAIHLISHGADGVLHVGAGTIDAGAIERRSAEIAEWSNALTDDADLLIYGCDVAASPAGRLLVDALARLTGADVAASEDTTGSAALGGDWILEYHAGAIDSPLAISATAQAQWSGVLSTDTVLVSYDPGLVELSDTSREVSSTQSVGQTFTYDSPGATYSVDKVGLVLYRTPDADPGQTITVSLLATWSGAVIASGTISSDALFTSESWNTVALSSAATLNDAQSYVIRVDSSGTGKVYVGMDDSGAYTGGDAINNGGVTEIGKDIAFRIIDTTANAAAPVLAGANNLAGIAEDAVTNAGTLVSSLISGQVTDADAGALSGMAVTAVVNTNGTWQYSTNGGTSWSNFGTPSAANARLLAADANTYVRFVPAEDWSGTVTNGLTFRAWDQTSGTAGGTADTTQFTSTVRDNFTSVSYWNSDGTANWTGAWVDGDGPSSGSITVNGSRLELATLVGSDSIYREANLSYASSATLSFGYTNELGLLGTVSLELSANGGTSYTTVNTFGAEGGSGTYSVDISAYAASDTRVRLVMNSSGTGGRFSVDDVQISYVTPLNGGETAFSSATAASSITVGGANDAPVGTSNTVTTNEDTAFTFTAAHFGFTDPNDSPANALSAVKITTLPGAGSLTLSGGAVSAGQFISVANITGGNLVFTPAANANGAGYSSFTFQVQDDGGTSNGGADLDTTARTMTIDVTAVSDAPVLTGSNNLTAINEDAASNGGTLVSALIAGHVTDADAGALSGIAVTGITNTSGTWQYSIDGGGAWASFGNPSAGNARLLAADANTYVRFVPNANWNGTVANGLTFHAWDQTLGVNGGIATTIANPVLLDDFSTVSYENNDGTAAWSASWVDSDDGIAAGGKVKIDAGVLEVKANTSAVTMSRAADLSFANSATLSFSYNNLLTGGSIIVETSIDGGGSYTTIATFSDVANVGSGTFSADISAYMSTSTQIRFNVVTSNSKSLEIDSFRIDVGSPGTGGTAPLSAAMASSSIAVNAVNDAPAGASNTLTTLEDTALTFTRAYFGFTDAIDGNSLLGVRISTLPPAGTLSLAGAAVSAGQTVSASDIDLGRLVFTPPANANGASYASFTFQVQDDGGTANGGVDLAAARTMTVNVTSVNDAPAGADNTVTTNQDAAFTFSAAHFGFSDASDGNALAAVKVTTLPSAGSLTLSGAAVSSGQFVSVADLNAGNLVYTPVTNANGAAYTSFTFRVQDDGGTANGGIDLDAAARTMTVNVTALQDAPVLSGANVLGAISEDDIGNAGTSVSALIAGHASDPDAAALSGIAVIAADNSDGTWQYSTNGGGSWLAFGSPSAGTARLLAADASTYVRFVPDSNWNGTVANGLTFRAWDQTLGTNGGIAPTISNAELRDNFNTVSYGNNDGTAQWSSNWVDADGNPSGGAIHISGSDLHVHADNSFAYIYREADLSGATSATLTFDYDNDLDDDSLVRLQISSNGGASYTTLTTFSDSSGGSGTYSQDVSAWISAATRIRFLVADGDGGEIDIDNLRVTLTAPGNGGTTAFSTATASSSISVAAVNDAPRGQNNTVVGIEDTTGAFTAGMFGFSDSVEGHGMAGVRITTLASAGTLTLNGTAVTAGQVVGVADIDAGLLRFRAAPDANGASYATFTFQVQDDGGTANGGTDLDASARTMTVNVTSVNDAPAGADKTLTTNEDSALVLSAADFGFSDAADGNSLQAVKFASVSGAGALRLSGVAVTAGQSVSAADIAAGRLVFTPVANANGAGYASFTFQVQDDGGTANGGSDLDATARTMTVNVTSANDAPAGADKTLTTNEDSALVLSAADFGFSDAADGNSFQAVRIASVPSAGALTLSGTAVAAGQSIGVSDITAGRLVFSPAANANGAAYTSLRFQVQDDGGTLNGGVALDTVERTLTFDVRPVNDRPVATGATLRVTANTSLTLNATHFGFSDPDDTPANELAAVKISTLPTAGTLLLNGSAVTSGQYVGAADIATGKLVFSANGGAGRATFTFQVQDDGGVASGGFDFDTTPRTMTIDVSAPPPVFVEPVNEPVVVIAPAASTAPVANSPAPASSSSQQSSSSSGSGSGSGSSSSGSSSSSAAPSKSSGSGSESSGEGREGRGEGGGQGSANAADAIPDGETGVPGGAPARVPGEGSRGVAVGATVSSTPIAQGQVTVQRLDSAQTLKDARDLGTFMLGEVNLLAPITSDGVGGTLSLAMQSQSSSSAVLITEEARALGEELDQLRDSMRDQGRLESATVAATAATGMSLSVGYVVWLLRGGALLSTVLSSLPAWRFIDPLPVLGNMEDGDGDDDADDSLESLVHTSDAAAAAAEIPLVAASGAAPAPATDEHGSRAS